MIESLLRPPHWGGRRNLTASMIIFAAAAGIFVVGASAGLARNSAPEYPIGDYEQVPGQIYVRVTLSAFPLQISESGGSPVTGMPALDAAALQLGVTEIRKAFHMPEPPKDPDKIDLSRYYLVYFPDVIRPMDAVDAYMQCPEVEYAEPLPVQHEYYVPNDPRLNSQWHLDQCGFRKAWDVSKGSKDAVIGIVDSGIDMNYDGQENVHPDLFANLWVNPGEDLNGNGVIDWDEWDNQDNDHNGYRDDFYGWDITGRDNWPDDPWGEREGHGTHVAGIACAVTDNDTGVAGAAFGCRLMIAGCYDTRSDSLIANGDAGIEYCANNGADVINLSWGYYGRTNTTERDIIRSAQQKGVTIFAASGNDHAYDRRGNQQHYYPVAYDGVIGVGASDPDDNRADFSNYGDYTDLVSPGVSIVSTFPRGSYASLDGTSMASPLACGLGALMLSRMPDLTTDQLLSWMQRTATDISGVGSNGDYPGIKYRINADALLNATHPGLTFLDRIFTDTQGDHDGRFEPGETVAIRLKVANEVNHIDAPNAKLTISCPDTFVVINNRVANLGNIASGDTVDKMNQDVVSFQLRQGFRPHYADISLILDSDADWPETTIVRLTLGHPYILSVDDAAGGDFSRFYEADYDTVPLVHDSWTVADSALPSQSLLNEYSFLVWYTGNQRSPLSGGREDLLRGYLANGRSLLLTGQYIGDDHGAEAFHQDVLHAQHTADKTSKLQLFGKAGDPIGDGVTLLLVGAGGAGNGSLSPSTMEPVGGATELLRYGTPDAPGDIGGIYYGGDDYRLVYLGFALESVSGVRSTPRREFIKKVLDRFYQLDAPKQPSETTPAEYAITSVHPNPFNQSSVVSYQLSVGGRVNLSLYDISGRLVMNLVDGRQAAGSHQATINGASLSSGVYLLRLAWDGGARVAKVALIR